MSAQKVQKLLERVGKAAWNIGKGVANAIVPGAGIALQAAEDLIEDYRQDGDIERLREELQALLLLSQQEFLAQQQQAMAALKQELGEEFSAKFEQVNGYLIQLKGAVERGVRYQGDPTATTVPMSLAMNDPCAVGSCLPERFLKFQKGDHVPGRESLILEATLGTGGFGEVWKVRHSSSGKVWAFKFFIAPKAAEKFASHEEKVLHQLEQLSDTSGIVALKDSESKATIPWLQFEYIAGGDLSTCLKEWQTLPLPQQLEKKLQAILFLAETVGRLHRLEPPIIHRDLKPGNILTNGKALFVADFGIGVILDQELTQAIRNTGKSQVTTMQGFTALYASPQQKRGLKANARDDVYALSVLSYQLLRGDWTLECPTGDGWKRALSQQGLSPGAISLLARSWDAELEERPKDALAFAEELRAALRSPMPKTEPQPPTVETPQPAPKPVAPDPLVAPFTAQQAKSSQQAWAKHLKLTSHELTNGVGMKLMLIPPGTFQMGSTEEEVEAAFQNALSYNKDAKREWLEREQPQHTVTLTKPFLMSAHQVTQASFQKVMNRKPSHFQGDTLPVEQVTWYDCVEFCNKLSGLEKLSPYYEIANIKRGSDGEITRADVKVLGGTGYRLPTEAEWEYAARAGTTTPFPFGTVNDGTLANVRGDYPYGTTKKGPYKKQTTPVGSYPANGFGLFDTVGNVWEWCEDWYGEYASGNVTDPTGPATGSIRVNRGGGWNDTAGSCRSALRLRYSPEFRFFDYLGFRFARSSVK